MREMPIAAAMCAWGLSRALALDDHSTTVNGHLGTTLGHENLRVGVGLRQATSHPEVLARSARLAATNLMAGYN